MNTGISTDKPRGASRPGASRPGATRRPLSALTKIAFGTGAIGELVYLGLFNTFIGIYYNQSIGLSNSLIGAAVMLALIADAVSDPVVGMVSDRWRSRLGRRHPFLLVAPIPLALSMYLIFNPPAILHSSQLQLFLWLVTWTILSRLCITLYVVPHLALGGELSKDQHQRSQLFSANAVIGYVCGALFSFVAWGVFFAGERTRADGSTVPAHLDPAAYGPLVLTACACVVIGIWVCAAGTLKQVPHLSQPDPTTPRLSLGVFFAEFRGALRNRNYVFLMLGFFFFMISSGLYETFHVFVNTFYWELLPEDIRWLGLAAAPAVLTGSLLSPLLMRRFDRLPVMLGALIGITLFAQLVINLRLLGLMPENDSPILLPLLIANNVGFTFSLGVGTVAILSMIGDVIDENELTTRRRQEGLFYSARTFFAKASGSFGHFIAGLMLDLFVEMPLQAVPGELDPDVVTRLGIASGPVMGAAALISIAFYSQYRLSNKRHAEILSAIDAAATLIALPQVPELANRRLDTSASPPQTASRPRTAGPKAPHAPDRD